MTENEFAKRFAAVRRRIIAGDFMHLNDMQRRAVLSTEGPLLLLAGAGSGKTTVLINRIVNLLSYGRGSDTDEIPENVTEDDLSFLEAFAENPTEDKREAARSLCGVEKCRPWQIIAITFTNKAANELKTRLERVVVENAHEIWAVTFHSACVRILRRYIDLLGYDNSFTIYDSADSQSAIKRIIKELQLDDKTYPPRSVLSTISRAKDEMMSPKDFADEAEKTYDIRKKNIARIYSAYAASLKSANAVDFDDILLLTVQLLMQHTDVREYYQKKFRYVLVDEYQDTNRLQFMLTSLLADRYKNLCVVGDDDQSIYRFRGATIENILSFEENYRGARVIRLEQNYRSTGHILDAANAVIANNVSRKGKTLWTDKGAGDLITLHTAENESDEAMYVAGKIIAGVSGGARFSDFAVLYRMNVQSNALEYAFRRSAIPYRVYGGMKFFDRAEVKDMLAYLCVIHNPTDDLRLVRIINSPPRGIGSATVERALSMAQDEGVPLFEILRTVRDRDELSRAAGKITLFVDMLDELRAALETEDLDSFYDMLVDKTGYVRALEAKNTDEDRTRIENVQELKTNIKNYTESAENPTLAGFLDEVSLYTDLEQLTEDGDGVVMMTIHSAKGLEFPTVFIVGAEDGLFPGVRAIGDADEMEEERRLCYVAMTRAENKLYITNTRQRMLYGKTSGCIVSRFVGEIPSEHTEAKPQPRPRRPYSFGSPGECDVFAERKPPVKTNAVKIPVKREAPAQFCVGDSIDHRAFGRGVILSLRPMSGDALIEVDFEKCGLKKLMLRSAAQFMKKL